MSKRIIQSVGVDFDNTLVDYDNLIHRVAMERGLVGPGPTQGKKHVRDAIRELEDGEVLWQKVQALVYGPRMPEATISPGAMDFLRACSANQVKVSVVSHKTEFANYDETGTNLRSAALAWLEANRLLDIKNSGLSVAAVYFESTRQEKLERILRLGCSHFIDDLEETFLEKTFPETVEKILYNPQNSEFPTPGVKLAGNWQRITEYLFPNVQ